MPTVGQVAELRWGYTMSDIDGLVKVVGSISYRSFMLDFSDRWETAWDGIIVHLYGSEERPTRSELIQVGLDALSDLTDDWYRHQGYDAGRRRVKPNAVKYWGPVISPHHGFDETVAERLALPQVLGVLSAMEYDALTALAVHGSNAAAAAALGINTKAYTARLGRARRKFLAAWFDNETPRRLRAPATANTCRADHPRDKYGFTTSTGAWACRECKRISARRLRYARVSEDERASKTARVRAYRARVAEAAAS